MAPCLNQLTQLTQLTQLYSCACEQLQYFFFQHYQKKLEREFRDAERRHHVLLPRWTKDYFLYYIYIFYIFLVILSSIVAIRTVVSTVRWCFTAPYWLLAVPAISGWIALSDLGFHYF